MLVNNKKYTNNFELIISYYEIYLNVNNYFIRVIQTIYPSLWP